MRALPLLLLAVLACGGSQKQKPETPPATSNDLVLVSVDDKGVAVGGHDPVAYATDKAAVKGSDQHASSQTLATYHFASAEHKQTFEKDPATHAPRYGGYCAYAASQNRLTPGDPQVWRIIDGKLMLFANPGFRDSFEKDPAANQRKADENWPGLVAQNGKKP